ncbi:actin-related protein 10 [Coccinella septempunctata]|uniref:actin-related protein 10 n=1 Tax=Coccinella septempunctata TaxID=41139 RepID=UPI001D07341B|nr:actin-related protein 10 [Coccinella septempunctata]
MPLYDSEKSVVILDIGTAYTKFGLTGEPVPRAIYRTEVKFKGKTKNLFDYEDEQELYDMLVEFFQDVYFKYAVTSPKDRPIVIVESLFCPIVFRENVAKVLFRHYAVSSLLFLSSHLVSVCTLAVDTALVLDVGYKEACCIPICFGMPLINAWQTLDIGSRSIHRNLQKLIMEKNPGGPSLSETDIENIKVRCCFVTKKERANGLALPKPNIEPCPDVDYPIEGAATMCINGAIREKTYEIMFEEDNDHLCLPTMILDALMNVDLHLRSKLAENILLIGGTTMAMGFKSRLREELLDRLSEERYKKLNVKCFKFHTSPSKENFTAWLGGSIYGATDWLTTKALSREDYLENNKIPDWSDLSYNSRSV